MEGKNNKIVGLYLAAGKSERMGRNKLLLPLGNKKLGIHALDTALNSNLDHIVVVSRDDEPSLTHWRSYLTMKMTVVPCPESVQGLSYSLNYGIQIANAFNPDGVIILLADQPFIHKKLIHQLIDVFDEEELLYVASCFKDIIRPPILIGKKFFPHLKQLKKDEGVKKIIRDNQSIKGKVIHYESEEPFIDIDTLEEYEHALRKINS